MSRKYKRKKKYFWEHIKDPVERAKAKAKFDAQLITFNRSNHPSTKFRGITNYAEIQKNLPSHDEVIQLKLKKNHPPEL